MVASIFQSDSYHLYRHFSGANAAADVENERPEPAERGEPAEEVAQRGLMQNECGKDHGPKKLCQSVL